MAVSSATVTREARTGKNTIEVTVVTDGVLRSLSGRVLKGSTVAGQLEVTRYGSATLPWLLSGTVDLTAALGPTDSAAPGATVRVPLTMSITADGLSASDEFAIDLGCASSQALCAGTCADLSGDTSNCGTCGNACTVQLSGSPYEGQCFSGRCVWPGVTVRSQASCNSVCGSVQFRGHALACTPSCSYFDNFAKLQVGLTPGSSAIGAEYFVGVTSSSSCTLVPADPDNRYGALNHEACCCGQ